MKSKFSRDNFKNNFLKNIIVRFDFNGVAEIELDNIITKIKPILQNAGYDKLKNEYATEMDLQLQDPETLEMESVPIREVRRLKVYVFTNVKNGIEFKISAMFAFISIQSQKYISFSEYSATLISVMNILKSEVPFFSGTRFGVRKINQCILKDIDKLNKYFEKKYFQVFNLEDNVSKLYQVKDCFLNGRYNINLVRTVVAGEYENQTAYQVSLDTDIYVVGDEEIGELLSDSAKVEMMNEKLFDIYKDAITVEFIEKLGQNSFCDEAIIGVENNE